VNRQLRKALGAVSDRLIDTAGRLFVRGRELDDATRACRDFAVRGMATTIGYFNGETEAPRAVANVYLATLDALEANPIDAYLSLKAPALAYDAGLLDEVVARAARAGRGIHFDSHDIDSVEPTLAAIERATQRSGQIGCTLPGRWKRSIGDARRAIDLGLRVRVVKGQWADPDEPLRDGSAGFLAVIDELAGRARHVAVATHDPQLAREAVRRLRAAGTPCELELLVGLPMQASLRAAREAGVAVRAYVPFGVAWVPYALTRARERPYLVQWVVRDALVGRWLA
jgi:proline dehydrogenase